LNQAYFTGQHLGGFGSDQSRSSERSTFVVSFVTGDLMTDHNRKSSRSRDYSIFRLSEQTLRAKSDKTTISSDRWSAISVKYYLAPSVYPGA
jgi:hypothetical protein